MKKLIIAIDGPAGSGKTTTAKLVAEALGYVYIDTGAMYRAVTLAWLRSGEVLTDEAICRLLASINIEMINTPGGQLTLLNDEDVSEDIRLPEVTRNVSPVSAVGCVRDKLVEMQRQIGSQGASVLDGRDIGTVVFPNADLKIFLVASIGARARRRAMELAQKGIEVTESEIMQQITDRDNYDSSRSNSPLRKAADAIEIDTSEITIAQQTKMIIELARERIGTGSYR